MAGQVISSVKSIGKATNVHNDKRAKPVLRRWVSETSPMFSFTGEKEVEFRWSVDRIQFVKIYQQHGSWRVFFCNEIYNMQSTALHDIETTFFGSRESVKETADKYLSAFYILLDSEKQENLL